MEGTTTKLAPVDDLLRGDAKHDAESNERTLIGQDNDNEPVLDRPRADDTSEQSRTRRRQAEDAPETEKQAEITRDLIASNTENDNGESPTPQNHTTPSDDVSLNLGGNERVPVPEQDGPFEQSAVAGGRIRNNDIVEERRVAFLPPPRVSPVFIPPHSSYPVGPPPIDSAYGTPPMGQIGVHYPREIVRIERDYSGGELVQFYSTYPLELEGRITPTQWLDTVNGINEILISAHSLRRAAVYHILSVLTLYISSMFVDSHYEKEMSRLRTFIDQCNEQLYHSQGLNILWPRSNGFLFLEIEYY